MKLPSLKLTRKWSDAEEKLILVRCLTNEIRMLIYGVIVVSLGNIIGISIQMRSGHAERKNK